MNRQNVLLIVLVLTLAAGAYVWFSYLNPSAEEEVVGSSDEGASPEFLSKASILDSLKIDTAFFSSEEFSELVSGPPLPSIPDEINGRINPFAQF